jgi:GrpB-like predicted nucleotidyltransferase (UPF0157 family)
MPANSPVRVVDYDPQWPEIFRQLRNQIWPAVCDIAIAVEHVGSTSVPGMAAKPVIDLDIVVKSRADMPALLQRLAELGYRHRGNLGVEDREAFRTPEDSPPHHLYACVLNCAALNNHIALRDYLRNHPSEAEFYSALKKRLAEQFTNDRDRYMRGKTEFLLSILEKCGLSGSDIDRIKSVNA